MERSQSKKYDIILVFCPMFDVKEPPLGLAYIAENLSASGWHVSVRDLNLEFYLSNQDKRDRWHAASSYDISMPRLFDEDISAAARDIAGSGVPMVGFSVNQNNLPISVELARRIKRLNDRMVIIFGGPECFLKPDRDHIPADALDYFIVGDGEAIANNFLYGITKGGRLDDIEGVILAGKSQESAFNPRIYPPHKDLAAPLFKDFRVGEYPGSSLPAIFTRGCVRNCAFCNDQSYYRPFSAGDHIKTADALQYYIETYGINTFSFHDQAINGHPGAFKLFLEEIICRRMEINWSSNIIVRPGMDRELFDMARRAGCRNLVFGMESFSNNVLRRMNKGFNAEEAARVLGSCKESGIGVFINLLLGFPGETEDDVNQTIDFLTQNRKMIDKVLNLSTCYVAPRCALERKPDDFGIVLPENHFSNWYTTDKKNTNKSRIELVYRIKAVLEGLKIPIEKINILQDDSVYFKLDDCLKRDSIPRSRM